MNCVTILKVPMETTEVQTVESTSRNAGEEYLRIIHLDHLPKTPEDMPVRVFLPPGALGSLEQAIVDTNSDGRERSQVIDYINRKGFVPGKVFVGSNDTVNKWSTSYQEWKALFGRKGFASFHTHPLSTPFSESDIAFYIDNRRLAFIHLLGTKLGISAIFQTDKSAKMPFSSTLSTISAYKRFKELNEERLIQALLGLYETLDALIDNVPTNGNIMTAKESKAKYKQEFVRALEDEGFAYYEWLPPTGQVKPGDLRSGL